MQEDVKKVLDQLRPGLQADGGDVELEEVGENGTVRLRLTGLCGCCHAVSWMHRLRIERTLREELPVTKVIIMLGSATCPV